MKQLLIIFCLGIFFINCEAQPDPTNFSNEALKDTFITIEGKSLTLESILNTYKGQTILIDVWASWCRDCIVGLPDLKALQKEHSDVVYLFLSMDKTQKSWKNGIDKYKIDGAHYFMPSGWDSAFSEFVDLDWIPRYMIIDKDGHIKLFRAVKISDPKIKEHLK
ncbi:TlpA disulfide reductase family protein [uncultured Psychroserpens sp.]|uniref:TlpA family protein disulfide reductase n=1 Tax=uncultured Psychroserpens sp. TaxID=255436 RepID=UPI00261D8F06|nr:TlpA disulfide reductase family protein [uncultured Psychroserpens sp.]